MDKKIIDISMELSNETPQWPGDRPFEYSLTATKEESGSVNVGELKSSTHMGTHIDAPFHYDNDGLTIDQMPLEIYMSKAQVMDVRGLEEITSGDLKNLEDGVTTVLLKTGAWQDRTTFPGSWPVFNVSIASWLKDNGIRLLGVDVPSVDQKTSKDMEMHQAMNRENRYILESVVLDGVEEGVYELVALPLKIKGAEGSPVRAVLYK